MTASTPEMIIVSGLSGSGKSVALQSLEDMDYYCIDNLPAVLLPEFAKYLNKDSSPQASHFQRGAAVSIDSRNKHFLLLLDNLWNNLEQANTSYRLLFLEADEQALIRRYSETRRKHPLTDLNTPLIEGIQQERELLQPLRERAEKILNTSDTTPHELRRLIRDFSTGNCTSAPLFSIESFGFKYGLPQESDFVFDVRCLPNPYWQEDLRALTGLDPTIIDYLSGHQDVEEMVEQIHRFLKNWLPGFAADNRSYITVAIGCTGGRHRSVYVAEQLKLRFTAHNVNVQVRHRELNK